MRSLDSGKDKIKKICDELRRETLEPAQNEANKILQEAHAMREELLAEAKKEAEQYQQQARREIEQERNVFESSLDQAVKQSIETLKQKIENQLFNQQLSQQVDKEGADPKMVAKIIQALVDAVNKEGISTDLSAIIPKTVSSEEVNGLLLKDTLKQLKGQSVELGEFGGGVKLRLHKEQMTIDMSDIAMRELLASFLREKYRKLLFAG